LRSSVRWLRTILRHGIYRSLLPASRETLISHLFTNLMALSNVEVNTLQRLAAVGVQKVVAEDSAGGLGDALEGTPMVATCAAASHFRSRRGRRLPV